MVVGVIFPMDVLKRKGYHNIRYWNSRDTGLKCNTHSDYECVVKNPTGSVINIWTPEGPGREKDNFNIFY